MSGNRRVLVTGGAGFIASHVAEAYLGRGDEVCIVDDLSSGKRENLPAGARFVEMDVADPEIRAVVREFRPHIVNHHAAQIDVRISVSAPEVDARTNILGLLNLTESALEAGSERFVYVSSGGVVYGEPARIPTPESEEKLPLSPYGVSKLAGEFYLNYYRRVRGLEYVALRYGNVYGPRQDPHGEAGVVAIFSNRLLSGTPLTVFGDGEQTRDYVFVEDVVSANLFASEMELPDGGGIDAVAFNVGTGVGTSVNRLADVLEAIAGVKPGRNRQEARPGELRDSTLDCTALRSRGWSPEVDLETGLAKTFHHIEARTAAAGDGA